ncbi:hypothetical protein DJ564_03360 [Pseudomonas sp. 31-12]|nr:hypothetical protein DJ564_03360 [Pseudomonas sp. 31-12]
MNQHKTLWRGSLLPPGCEAAPKPATEFHLANRADWVTTASQPSGSKLPRHKSPPRPESASA